jgi:hypothetical protein
MPQPWSRPESRLISRPATRRRLHGGLLVQARGICLQIAADLLVTVIGVRVSVASPRMVSTSDPADSGGSWKPGPGRWAWFPGGGAYEDARRGGAR